MQTRQQTRRIQEQKNKGSSQSTCSPIATARIQIIKESMTVMTPTTLREVNEMIAFSTRARNNGELTWLNIAVIYRAFQVSWQIVLNSSTSTASITNFAAVFRQVATRNLIPSDLDAAYMKAEKQIAEITDNPTKEYALRVFPSKAQFVHQLNLSYRTANEYINGGNK